MSMDAVANALLYWQIVEACLVELHHWDPAVAHAKVLRVRGRMTERAVARNITYHLPPFSVASDLAHVIEPVSDAKWSVYQELATRVTAAWQAEAQPENPKTRKPSVNAWTKARAIAALSR
jgi:hypothetical protein